MTGFWLALAAGTPIVLALAHQGWVGRQPAALHWASGWVAFIVSGFFSTFPLGDTGRGLGDGLGALSAALALSGALAFRGAPVTRWLWVATGAVAAGRVAAWWGGAAGVAQWLTLGFQVPALLAAAAVVARHPHGVGAAERLLPLAFAALAVLSFADPFARGTDLVEADEIVIWTACAIGLAVLEVTALQERSRQRLERHLARAQRLNTLATLAGGVAHDFNNQLAVVLGNAELLSGALPDDLGARRSLTDLRQAAERCAALTRNLLAFGRRASADPEPVDLKRALAGLEELLRAGTPATIGLEVDVDGGTPAVQADPAQLEQIVINLVANARDAIRGSGVVRVSSRSRPLDAATAARLEVAPGRYVELEVSDDGAGMDAETRERAFDPFFTTKARRTGAGLGLAVVYGAVRSHGGQIELESEPGRGSRFRVLLPEASGSPRAEALRAAPPVAHRSAVLLVAEDEPALRRFIVTTLERAGHRVVQARDGEEAVLRARDPSIEGLVLDLSMPRRDGLDALAEIRRTRPRIPALLMSGDLGRVRAQLPASLATLAKPFSGTDLEEQVARMLARSEMGP